MLGQFVSYDIHELMSKIERGAALNKYETENVISIMKKYIEIKNGK